MVSTIRSRWVRGLRGTLLRPALLLAAFSCALGALCASPAFAQQSTSAIRGNVTSAEDELPIAGAEVTMLHVPSGQRKKATTDSEGGFAFTALSIGGPYTVTVTAQGFVTAQVDKIFLTAGKTRDVQFGLQLSK